MGHENYPTPNNNPLRDFLTLFAFLAKRIALVLKGGGKEKKGFRPSALALAEPMRM